jgi:hypothetical protein
MLNAELHSRAELFGELAELDELPFVRQRPVLGVQTQELHTSAGLFDDLLELAPRCIDGSCRRSNRFARMHFLF